MSHPEVVEVPSKLGPELEAVVGLHAPDHRGQAQAQLAVEGGDRLDRIVVAHLQDLMRVASSIAADW